MFPVGEFGNPFTAISKIHDAFNTRNGRQRDLTLYLQGIGKGLGLEDDW